MIVIIPVPSSRGLALVVGEDNLRKWCYTPGLKVLASWLVIDTLDQRSDGFATMGLLGPLPASMSRFFVGTSLPSLYPWVPTPIPQALDLLLGPQLHPAPRVIGR